MNQKALVDRLKLELNRFPNFFKSLVQQPLQYIDTRTNFDWLQILLYTFLVEAISHVAYNLLTLNISGVMGSVIFMPIQALVVLAFLAFVVWFIVDRFKWSNVTVLEIFRAMAFIEIIVSLFVVLLAVLTHYLKIFELFYVLSIGTILVKCLLFHRALNRQLNIAPNRSALIAGVFALVFLLPPLIDFVSQYQDRHRARTHQRQEDRQMEESIKAIEEEFNTEE